MGAGMSMQEVARLRKKSNRENMKEINNMVKEAKANGMTYGELQAERYKCETKIRRKW